MQLPDNKDCVCCASAWDEAKLGIVDWHHLFDEAVHNPLQDFHDLLCQLETAVVAHFQCTPLTFVVTDNETLLPVRGYLAAAKSRIMEASMSPAASIFSITMPDGSGALPAFIWKIAFLTISMVIGIGGPSTGGSSDRWSGSQSNSNSNMQPLNPTIYMSRNFAHTKVYKSEKRWVRTVFHLNEIIFKTLCLIHSLKPLRNAFLNTFTIIVVKNDILLPLQSEFIPGDSTVDQLTYLYDTCCHALDSSNEVRVVFCGISKAFDCVWHAGLIQKLKAAGIAGILLNYFIDYLSNRKQWVTFSCVKSYLNSLKAGVPQGSILGPLLFLLYINDIVKDICSNIHLFTDDTSLYIVVEDPTLAAELLNSDLKSGTVGQKWLVSINPFKTESL